MFWLKKNGYLNPEYSYQSGGINWSYGWSENKSGIGFSIILNGDKSDHIQLKYTHTDHWSEEKSQMDYGIPLTSTSCNYGGKRYWFICPLYKNGRYCGRRVGTLFSIGKWFGCRHCGDIAYQSQFEGGLHRAGSLNERVVEESYNEIKRWRYDGKPTKRYRRYLRLREKMDREWEKMAIRFGIVP